MNEEKIETFRRNLFFVAFIDFQIFIKMMRIKFGNS